MGDGVDYDTIKILFDSHKDTVEILTTMFGFKDDHSNHLVPVASASQGMVNIDVLREKNVFLFISSLENISEIEISALKSIYEETKKRNDYIIVWMVMMERNEEERQKFWTILPSVNEIFWYVLPLILSESVAGISKFIKEDWHYDDKPILVVMDSRGRVRNPNAFQRFHTSGISDFPFIYLVPESRSFDISNLIFKKKKYTFLYGGKVQDRILEFSKNATEFIKDPLLDDLHIKIKLKLVSLSDKNIALYSGKKANSTTKEIPKLHSTFNQWAVLTKDTKEPGNFVIGGDGTTFLRVFHTFDQWKEALRTTRKFSLRFTECYNKIGDV